MRVIGAHRRNPVGSWSKRTTFASFLACGLLASLAPAAGAVTFSNTAPITIPPAGSATPYPSEIPVTGLTGTITDVNVKLNGYSHQFSGDTHVVLVPPGATGQNILLMAGAGGSAAIPPPGVDITLDDGNPPLPNTAFPSGTYKPTARATNGVFPAPGPGNNFCSPGIAAAGTPSYVGGNCSLADALNGSAPNGTWKLYVIDIGAPDAGMIAGGVTLDITAGGPATTPQPLTVTKTGTGTGGSVRGLGISCGAACTKQYNSGTSVTLTATGDAFNVPSGFTGCDSSTGPTNCTVTMSAAKNVTATFDALPRTLNVGKVGSGSGTVSGEGINCGGDCAETYPSERSVTLTSTPAAGSSFAGWIGCESPSGNTCTVNATANKNVTARFTQNPFYALPTQPSSPGRGSPPGGGGIACPAGNSAGVRCTGRTKSGGLVIVGTNGDDRIVGTGKGDRITGGGGRDTINGGGGSDSISGGSGSDRISGGSGNDSITGGSGNDRITGGSGNDRVNGNSGNDRISGGSGNDGLSGSSGNDTISGGSGKDRLAGGSGSDRLNGNSGNDSLRGDSGKDRLSGSSGNDRLSGGSGKDRLSGGSGKNKLKQ